MSQFPDRRATAKILFLASNPFHTDRLRIDAEARGIENKLQGFLYKDQLTFNTAWATRADDLVFAIDHHAPTILHFAGHGEGDTGFALDDGSFIDAASFGQLARMFRGDIELVVLNYCKSVDQAAAVSEHVRYVIYTTTSVSDDAAVDFSSFLYLSIAYGNNCRDALERAKLTLKVKGSEFWDDWSILFNKTIGHKRLVTPDREDDGSGTKQTVLLNERGYFYRGVELRKDPEFLHLIERYKVGSLRTDYAGISEAINSIGDELIRLTGGVAFLVIDVDEMTLVNKHHGIEVGNQVLKEIIKFCEHRFSESVVSRCGDDTVMIVFGQAQYDAMRHISESLCEDIKRNSWQAMKDGLFVSCSAGFSVRKYGETSIDAFIRATIGMVDGKKIARGLAHAGPFSLSPSFSRKVYQYISGDWDLIDSFSVFEPRNER
ncbi:diguanylate cyclase [Bradyrhizobium sp. U87765 SZCCT0131]|uniref:diguanylate cyclase domain-containing protein n=1 Tax=unclassified Bradyrhizobium TaxID=2631580 RepID=UPI001BA65431|nr:MULTISPECIES: diguanylate cyclase [unclassified Bradyrhizobium]MBR1216625.1 diguanylate cyclase [Bradyrhizobium sp. U87765 SZCCT0131]MBR1259619.1 diguanylate cyclase [Bradyrhizobium sp. U87765 SZCCT0134]MBR1305760.1 diguanylate cyclase [Bradyrhizobium sp. U87765 SZCCT0110]MBR1322127.1 diguanylate cyclase [Bradyrhizobium sp. U87765 SZCCT0109]MBR1350595.1 diguanylate cyclase [Bradyrhizobium sp. U87765 SZCCT0048]